MADQSELDSNATGRMTRRVEAFSDLLRGRAATYSQFEGPTGDLEQDPGLLRAALAELRAQHEELLTADEELRSQLEEVVTLTTLAGTERERYRELFDGAPQAHLVTDAVGVIREANRAAQELLSPEGRPLVGRPLAVLSEANDTRPLRDALSEATRTGRASVTIRLRRKGAPVAVAEMTCVIIEGGARRFWTLTQIDGNQSGERAREEQLERRLRDTEELLARERRIRAQLERNERARDRFIAVLSHDLRGPIHAVLGWAELLRRETFGKEARERALVTIERNARAQLGLVEELLDISRITTDKMRLEIVALDLATAARRVIESQMPVAAERKIELTCKLDSVTVFADRRRIEQVIQNLVTNALKFTPPGGRVHVRVEHEDSYAVLEIRDTGRGIDPAAQPTIFDCYSQAKESEGTRGGLGLGLFIVRQLIEMQGGTVEVESEGEGKGAAFTIFLPARVAAELETCSTVDLPESGIDLDRVHVLLVEDEHDIRELVGTLLLDRGARVSTAADLATALRMFESERPDVVVSDLGLPDGDGCDLVRRMRALQPDVAAIALSGFTFTSDVTRALDSGFRCHLAKPVDTERLVAAISELANGQKKQTA